jgi:hypothetical protein
LSSRLLSKLLQIRIYKKIILPVVLYGCETWSLTLVDNMRMDLGEVGWGDVDWIGLAQDRNRWRAVVNLVLNHRVP